MRTIMTSKVFEAMLQFSDQASKAVETVETTTNVTVTVTVESELVTVKTNQTKLSKKRKSGNNPELVYVFCKCWPCWISRTSTTARTEHMETKVPVAQTQERCDVTANSEIEIETHGCVYRTL